MKKTSISDQKMQPLKSDMKNSQKIMTKENCSFFMAATAFLWSILSTPLEKNHVILSVSKGDAIVFEQIGNAALLEVPVSFKLQNLSDGPIKINEIFLGFPKNKERGCEEYVAIGELNPIENDGFLQSSQSISHQQEYKILASTLPSEVCLLVSWRNQKGYQRVYLESIGRIDSATFSEASDGTIGVAGLNGGLADIVSVFGPSSCVTVMREEFCI